MSITRCAAILMLAWVIVAASALCCCLDLGGQAMAAPLESMAKMSDAETSAHHSHGAPSSSDHDHAETCLEFDCSRCVSGDVFVPASADVPSFNKSGNAGYDALYSDVVLAVLPPGMLVAIIHPDRGPPQEIPATLVDLKVLLLI